MQHIDMRYTQQHAHSAVHMVSSFLRPKDLAFCGIYLDGGHHFTNIYKHVSARIWVINVYVWRFGVRFWGFKLGGGTSYRGGMDIIRNYYYHLSLIDSDFLHTQSESIEHAQ